jgi:uncharacterized protein (TIGR00290 family)
VKPRALLAWSSGKDSAFALHVLREQGAFDVVGLFTTVTRDFDRVAMHATRRALLEAQARAARLPLHVIEIPYPCPNEAYESAMTAFNAKARADSITHLVFGDLFLEDIRRYREIKLEGSGLTPLFPLWGRPTDLLARQMIEAGFCAYLVCVDPKQLDPGFAGRRFDHAFLEALPPGIDPCGENGEFHSCVVDGPIFEAPIPVVPGEIVTRDGFVFADLIPAPL